MRNSGRRNRPRKKACRTCSASPHTCRRTRTPLRSRSRRSDSDNAAQSRTSTCNSATLRASDSGESCPRITSLRSAGDPRRWFTTSNRAAVSSTGDTRSCQIGRATVTSSRGHIAYQRVRKRRNSLVTGSIWGGSPHPVLESVAECHVRHRHGWRNALPSSRPVQHGWMDCTGTPTSTGVHF